MVIAAIAIAVLIALARSGLLGMALQGTTLSAVAPVADVLALPARVLTRVWAGLVRTRDVARENTLLQERVAELERDLNTERERAAGPRAGGDGQTPAGIAESAFGGAGGDPRRPAVVEEHCD